MPELVLPPQLATCDFIVTIDVSGTIRATPTNPPSGLSEVIGTEFGAVINACVTQLGNTNWGSGAIGVTNPLAYGNDYPWTVAIDMHNSDLIGESSYNTYLSWSGASPTLILQNAGNLQGLTIESNATTNTINCANYSSFDLHFPGATFVITSAGAIVANVFADILLLNSGATENWIAGLFTTVTDNSGQNNVIINAKGSNFEPVFIKPSSINGQVLTTVSGVTTWAAGGGSSGGPYDYVVSVNSSGTITATPTPFQTGLSTETGTELGAVINACVGQLAGRSGAVGSIFITNPVNGNYTWTTEIVASGCDLIGESSVSTYLSWSGASGVTVLSGATDLRNLRIFVGSGSDIINAGSGLNDNLFIYNGSFTVTSGPTYISNVRGSTFILILNNGVAGCTIEGNFPSVNDNSNQVNFIRNTANIGDLGGSTPAISTGATNIFGAQIQVVISIGSTSSTVGKSGVAQFTGTNACVSLILDAGQYVTLSSTVGVSWTWARI